MPPADKSYELPEHTLSRSQKGIRALIRAFEDRMNTVREPPAADEPFTPPQDVRRLIDRDAMHYLAAVRGGDARAFRPSVLR